MPVFEHHVKEWLESAVCRSIIDLNVVSLKDFEVYDRLLYGLLLGDRRNDGRLRDKWLKKYAHCEHGGWWVSGVDIIDPLFGEDIWGQQKPDLPRRSFDRRRLIKYEAPPKQPTGIFAAKVPLSIWQAIANRYDVPLPENIVVTSEGRAKGFWAWVIANPKIPIIITEGAKKAGAIITTYYVAIALPGIFNGYRQSKDQYGRKKGDPTLIPQLKAIAQKEREIIFCFDRDLKPSTVKNVNRAILTTGRLFENEGCKVSRIIWEYKEKGVDDLIVAWGSECFDKLYQKRSPLPKSDLFSLLDLSKYEPVRISQQYLDSTIVIPKSAQLIGIKSPKGSNKTGLLSKISEQAIYRGKPVLVLTHRIQLTKELCNRFGVDHIEELKTSDTAGMLGYGFCIDSLHPNSQTQFNPENWDEAVVILDEVEQTIWHALNSQTCEKNRVAIIQNLQALLRNVIETNGKIFVSDADLSTISIDYIQSLIDRPFETWIIENKYVRSDKRKLTSYSGNDPSNLFADLIEFIEEDKKVFIQTTGQKADSKWGTINIESYLTKKFPKLNIIRIDGESVADPNHPAYGCMANLDFVLAKYDIAIASPVIETGVSIDLKNHFDAVWAIAYGIQSVNAVCQTVARVREDLPRYIWIKKTAKNNCIGNGSTYINSLLASENKQAVANIQQLHLAGISEFNELEINFSPSSLQAWAKRACIINYGKNNYRKEVVTKLIEEGYELSTKEDKYKETFIRQEIKENCQQDYQEFCQAIIDTETPTPCLLETLKSKRAKTYTQRLQWKKGNLVKKYGVEVTPKLIEDDDRGLYSQLQLYYYLSIGKKILIEKECKKLRKFSEEGEGKVFSPDLNKRQLLVKVRTLQIINTEQFFNSEAEFSKESLSDWLNNLIVPLRFDIKSVLGVSINPKKDSPIAVAQRLLKKLGLKLKFKCWKGNRQNKQRIYTGCELNLHHTQILNYWRSLEDQPFLNAA